MERVDVVDPRGALTRHNATEWTQSTLESGLQNPGHGFDSRRRLQKVLVSER